MPNFNIIKEVTPKKSFRVASILDKYDIQDNTIKEVFKGNIDLSKAWNVGIIYGCSGSGKSTIAKEIFKDDYIDNFKYSGESVLDDFPENSSIDEITKTLNSVGFSSPPSWLKAYSVLSTGEKMRVDLARALLSDKKIIVFDEFTSVVNREVAKISSYAISKSVKRDKKKFIAISCHDDILPWLEPDWVFNTNIMEFRYTRGFLQRPEIKCEIYQKKGFWEFFRKYHYLNHEINPSADQFVAVYKNNLIGFCAVCHFPHPKNKRIKRIHRLVILPDYQGVGIGIRLLNFVANIYKKANYDIRIVTSTPALIKGLQKKWILVRQGHVSPMSPNTRFKHMNKTSSRNRITTSWKYI